MQSNSMSHAEEHRASDASRSTRHGIAVIQTFSTDPEMRAVVGAWDPVRAELERWAAAGKMVRLWLRDDDAIEPTPQLDRLIALGSRFDVPILLAVIPMQASAALARRAAGAPYLRLSQHGFAHRNHAPPGRKAEFDADRPLETMCAELAAGRDRMRELFGEAAHPVFVPPWNRIAPALVERLPQLGFTGLSTIRARSVSPVSGLTIVNSDLDIIDWKHGRVGRSPQALIDELLGWLRARRQSAEAEVTLGIIMHHLVHDEVAWDFIGALLSAMCRHPAVAMADPAELFNCTRAERGGDAAMATHPSKIEDHGE